jgi:carbamoyl-phosphate synthase large subunit
VPVPRNIAIDNEEDLRRAFAELGDANGKIWLRAASIGGGGKGSIPTADYALAKAWIDHYRGWGDFVAAQMLTPDTITWLSIWYHGELIVAQSRERRGWTHGNRSISRRYGRDQGGRHLRQAAGDGNCHRRLQSRFAQATRHLRGRHGV